MSPVVALVVGAAILLWPERFDRRRLETLPGRSPALALAPRSLMSSAGERAGRRLPGRRADRVTAQDLLGLLEVIAPALEAGMAPGSALRMGAEVRSGSGQHDPLAALASDVASAAAEGARLAPVWRHAAESSGSDELLLLAQAWSLTEDMGVPLAHAVRTTAELLEARIAQERRLSSAVAGARATVNVLTVLPIGGPLLALVLGIGPAELYAGSTLTQLSLVLGALLAGVGRWWVRRMVRAVACGPVIS